MNGPLLAALFVAAAITFIAWFCWLGLRQPSSFVAWASLYPLVFIFSVAIAMGYGKALSDALGVALLVNFCMLAGQLRSWMRGGFASSIDADFGDIDLDI